MDVSQLPPSVILYAGFDPLRDEAAAYAGRLREKDVPVETLYFPDMIHDFMLLGGALPAADVAIRARGAGRRQTAGGPKPRKKGFASGSGVCTLEHEA